MKKVFILFILILNSCSTDKTDEQPPQTTCYSIISRGFDERGNYIIVKISNFNNKRFEVANYLDYLNQSTICEPINLTEQPL